MAIDPGLDLQQLSAIRGRQLDHTSLLTRVAGHIDHHGGYVTWSGGKDSTVVVDLARRVDPAIPVVVYDCGLEFPDTLTFIRQLTEHWNLNLHVIATEPDLLTALIAAGDFHPDRPTRRLPFDLRERMYLAPARIAHDRFGSGSLWGVRAAESTARRHLYRNHLAQEATRCRETSCHATAAEQRAYHAGVIHRLDGTVTFGPIWDWTDQQVFNYLAARQIPENPIYGKLRALGAAPTDLRVDAMVDPLHLDRGQIVRLKRGWPTIFDRLVAALPGLALYG